MLGILKLSSVNLGNLEKMQDCTQLPINWEQDHSQLILLTHDYRHHRSFCKTCAVGGVEHRKTIDMFLSEQMS